MKYSPHFQPTSYTVRFYEPGGSYENGDPYVAVCTVQMFGEDAYVSGFLGVMTPFIYRTIRTELKRRGSKRVFYERASGALRELKKVV